MCLFYKVYKVYKVWRICSDFLSPLFADSASFYFARVNLNTAYYQQMVTSF